VSVRHCAEVKLACLSFPGGIQPKNGIRICIHVYSRSMGHAIAIAAASRCTSCTSSSTLLMKSRDGTFLWWMALGPRVQVAYRFLCITTNEQENISLVVKLHVYHYSWE